MWPIEKILIDEMQKTKSDFEEFIASDYFNKLDDNSKEIVKLRLEVVETNISIFSVIMKQRGQIGEIDYCELLESHLVAKDSLIKYQKKIMLKFL